MKLNRYFSKSCARSVAISLLAAIACAFVMFAPGESFSSPQKKTAPPVSSQKDDDPATVARQELQRIPLAKIQKVKDAKLRKALQEARNALERVANNRNKSQEEALLNSLESHAKALENAALSAGIHYSSGKCGSKFETCQGGCKAKGKKLCGCFAKLLGCITLKVIDAIF